MRYRLVGDFVLPCMGEAKPGKRSVFYSYYGECFMWVTVAETPSGSQYATDMTSRHTGRILQELHRDVTRGADW